MYITISQVNKTNISNKSCKKLSIYWLLTSIHRILCNRSNTSHMMDTSVALCDRSIAQIHRANSSFDVTISWASIVMGLLTYHSIVWATLIVRKYLAATCILWHLLHPSIRLSLVKPYLRSHLFAVICQHRSDFYTKWILYQYICIHIGDGARAKPMT